MDNKLLFLNKTHMFKQQNTHEELSQGKKMIRFVHKITIKIRVFCEQNNLVVYLKH